MAQIRTGKVTVTNGSNVVTGVGTGWVTLAVEGAIQAGHLFHLPNDEHKVAYTITYVSTTTEEIRLASSWQGQSKSNASYAITNSFSPTVGMYLPDPSDVDMALLIKDSNKNLDNYLANNGGGGGGGVVEVTLEEFDANKIGGYLDEDAVSYLGKIYEAKQDVPQGILPTNATYWQYHPSNAEIQVQIDDLQTKTATANNETPGILSAVDHTRFDKAELHRPHYAPEEYGAAGDGSTDDTAALQACFNAAFAAGKKAWLSKKYYISSTLTVKCSINGAGSKTSTPTFFGNNSIFSGATIVGDFNGTFLSVESNNVELQGFAICTTLTLNDPTKTAQKLISWGATVFENVSQSTTTFGGGVLRNVDIRGGYVGLYVAGVKMGFTVDNCRVWRNYVGIKIETNVAADDGDSNITNSVIQCEEDGTTGYAGILWTRGGGWKISNNKFIGGQYCIKCENTNILPNQMTITLPEIVNNSFESSNGVHSVTAIHMTTDSSTHYSGSNVIIVGNEIWEDLPIYINGFDRLIINDNMIAGTEGAGTWAIDLVRCDGFMINGNIITRIDNGIRVSSDCTNGSIGINLIHPTVTGIKISNASESCFVFSETSAEPSGSRTIRDVSGYALIMPTDRLIRCVGAGNFTLLLNPMYTLIYGGVPYPDSAEILIVNSSSGNVYIQCDSGTFNGPSVISSGTSILIHNPNPSAAGSIIGNDWFASLITTGATPVVAASGSMDWSDGASLDWSDGTSIDWW